MKKSAKILTLVLTLAMLFSILTVVTVPASAATISTGEKIYLNAGGSGLWDQGSAWFSVYFMNSSKSTCKFVAMTKDSASGYYVAEAPSGTWTYVIFVRNNPVDKTADWTNVWNQTADLSLQTGTNLYTITGWSYGSWSSYTPACTSHNYNAYGKCTNAGCTAGHTYTVAGCEMVNGVETLTDVFGTSWGVTDPNNDMLYDSATSTYTKVYENVPAGTYAFKCAQDHAWTTAYPSTNKTFTVATSGSKVTITLKGSTVNVVVEAPHVHSYEEKVTTEATCETAGLKTFTCSCGDSYTQVIEALGHDIVIDEAVEVTCTTNGLTAGQHCTRCNDKTVVQEVIEALGHNYVNDYCTVCGGRDPEACDHEYTYACDKICNKCFEETRPEADHKITHVEAKNATCSENGNVEYWSCSICNYVWTDEALTQQTNAMSIVVPATHTWVDADCDTAKTCSVCGATEGDPLGHTAGDAAT